MKDHSTRLGILMSLMYSMGMNTNLRINTGPKVDERIINPPQSEESKQYYLKKAAEKRERKRLKNV